MEVVFFMILAGMFGIAATTCLLDERPGIAGVMAFTSAVLVCTVAMAVS